MLFCVVKFACLGSCLFLRALFARKDMFFSTYIYICKPFFLRLAIENYAEGVISGIKKATFSVAFF